MNFWPCSVWGILLLAVFEARAQQTPATLPPAQVLRVGIFPARENIAEIQGNSSIYTDRESLHVAAVAHVGQQFVVYTDGRRGPAFDAIGGLAVSPAGGHVACAARKGAQWYLVFDGKVGAPCDGINEAWDYKPQYGPTGPFEGYSIGEPGPDAALCFSDDGKHFCYALQKGIGHSVVMDGQPGPEYDGVGELMLSADGQHFAYLAKQGARQFAVIDGKAGPAYSGVGPLVLSHDGRHSAYVAWQAKKYFVVEDGQAGPPFDFISLDGLNFSADGAHLSYNACTAYSHKWLAVVDGRALPQDGREPIFSADGRHLAFVEEVAGNTAAQVVVDGKPGPEYSGVSSLQFSLNGRHVAYLAKEGQQYFEVFDGNLGPKYDLIAEQILSPNGRRIAYEARIGVPGQDSHGFVITNDTDTAPAFVVVDGAPGRKYDAIWQLIFSPDSRHFAYEAARDGHWLAVLDGKEGVEYSHLWGLKFSPDSKHLAYLAAKDNGKAMYDRMLVVVDGCESPEYEMVPNNEFWRGTEAPAFTPNGSLSWFAVRGASLYHVTQPLAK